MNEYVILRVDRIPVWFKEYGKDGKTVVTANQAEAMRLSEGEAQIVLHDLKQERGGVWSIRKAASE